MKNLPNSSLEGRKHGVECVKFLENYVRTDRFRQLNEVAYYFWITKQLDIRFLLLFLLFCSSLCSWGHFNLRWNTIISLVFHGSSFCLLLENFSSVRLSNGSRGSFPFSSISLSIRIANRFIISRLMGSTGALLISVVKNDRPLTSAPSPRLGTRENEILVSYSGLEDPFFYECAPAKTLISPKTKYHVYYVHVYMYIETVPSVPAKWNQLNIL